MCVCVAVEPVRSSAHAVAITDDDDDDDDNDDVVAMGTIHECTHPSDLVRFAPHWLDCLLTCMYVCVCVCVYVLVRALALCVCVCLFCSILHPS